MPEPVIYCPTCQTYAAPSPVKGVLGVAWCGICGTSLFDNSPDWGTLGSSASWDAWASLSATDAQLAYVQKTRFAVAGSNPATPHWGIQ
jgi:hypothetical protein